MDVRQGPIIEYNVYSDGKLVMEAVLSATTSKSHTDSKLLAKLLLVLDLTDATTVEAADLLMRIPFPPPKYLEDKAIFPGESGFPFKQLRGAIMEEALNDVCQAMECPGEE